MAELLIDAGVALFCVGLVGLVVCACVEFCGRVFRRREGPMLGRDDPDRCPTCARMAVVQCRCPLGDRRCRVDHEWHVCPGCRTLVKGPGDHALDTHDPANLCHTCRSRDQG